MNDTLELLIPITAIVLGSLVVLIPIAGLTARFALKPIMEAIAQFRGAPGSDQRIAMLEQRMSLMEEQLHLAEREYRRAIDDADFHRQLDAPR